MSDLDDVRKSILSAKATAQEVVEKEKKHIFNDM